MTNKVGWSALGGGWNADATMGSEYDAGRRMARANPSTGSVYYFFVDHLGSTRAMTQANGRVAAPL